MRLLIVRLSSMEDVIHMLAIAANAPEAGAAMGWLTKKACAVRYDAETPIDAMAAQARALLVDEC